jgi:hypothetical protein
MISASFPSLLQSFFTDRLLRQREASPHTIAGYRDSFRLLLKFAKERLHKNHPNFASKTSMLPSLVFSSITWRALAKTALAPGMSGWVRSTLFSGTWLWKSPRMPCIASGSWRCPINATNNARSISSIGKRPMRCSLLQILPLLPPG